MAKYGGRTSGRSKLFGVTAIEPKVLSPARVRANILNELKRQGQRARNLLDLTTVYWVAKPDFKERLHYKLGDVFLEIYPFGYYKAVRNWQMVNDGTRVRYVSFSKDYRPKTQYDQATGRGTLGTNVPGRGTKWLDRSHPKPGIRGRHWDFVIYELMEGDFHDGIQEAIRKGLEPK
jgi:hypothetical protein